MILALSKYVYNEIVHVDETLEAVVALINEEDEDPEDFDFYEVDKSTKFHVTMKAVRKEVPISLKK